jgi:hypothetical protein
MFGQQAEAMDAWRRGAALFPDDATLRNKIAAKK